MSLAFWTNVLINFCPPNQPKNRSCTAGHSKIGYRYNFLNYLAFTYLILLWSEITTSATWSSKWLIHGEALHRASSTRPLITGQHDCSKWLTHGEALHRASSTRPLITGQHDCSKWLIHGEALHRASSTRPLITGQHDCVRAWRQKGIILNICCKQLVLFKTTRPQKQDLFKTTHSLLKNTHCTVCV